MSTNFHSAARDFNLSTETVEKTVSYARSRHIDLNSIWIDSHEFQMTVGAIETGLFTVISLPRNSNHSLPLVSNGKWNE